MSTKIRESYEVFPAITQPLWTWLTGKPLDDEKPLMVPSSWLYLAVSLTIFAVGVGFGIWCLADPSVSGFWAVLTIPAVVFGGRLLVLTIAHQCAHQMFCRSKVLNQVVHDILTTFVCSQDYDSYRYDHFYVHHGIKTFGTFEDPVLSFIRQLGFLENMSKLRLWGQLFWTLVSPKFHCLYLLNRLRSNFIGGRLLRRVFAAVWWGSVVALLVTFPAYIVPVLVAYILPIWLLFNISAFLELICEHVWMRPIGDAMGRQRISELSWGRFCGAAVPQPGDGVMAWAGWCLRTLFYHIPCRFLVLTGDAPQHDFHHFSPNTRDWTISAYARRDLIAVGKMEDREIWGIFHAIDIVFEQMSTVSDATLSTKYLRSAVHAKPE